MKHLLRDRLFLAGPSSVAAAALLLSALIGVQVHSAADAEAGSPSTALALTSPGTRTHTDLVLSDVGPSPVPAETRIDATVTVDGEPVDEGHVQFALNGKQFDAPVELRDGRASLRIQLELRGTYRISAVYTGYDDGPRSLAPSTSDTATFEAVTGGDGCVGAATCDATAVWEGPDSEKPPGLIIISTPYTETSPLTLPPFSLQQSATCVSDPTEYGTDAPFAGIAITDTRQGQRPWTASVQSEDLLLDGRTAADASARQRINSQNVGLTNLALTSTSSAIPAISTPRPAGSASLGLPINFTIFNNPSAEHLQGGATGTLGLGGTPKRIIHANKGRGTSMFVGTLTVTAPTSTAPGVYNGRLTFTVLGS